MNSSLTMQDIENATGGTVIAGDPAAIYSDVRIDSRKVQKGDLFVAIKGDNHDGHTFIDDVVRQGAGGVIIESAKADTFKTIIKKNASANWVAVKDTVRALGDLAGYLRRRSPAKVVAITGSNGKTTTRSMIQTIFSESFNTLASKRSFNNEIGLPLTLLQLSPHHQWAVVELGMNHFGEIRRLSAISRPNVGIITNIAPCHLKGVGSIDGVVKAKAEILENIEAGGTVILNRDDPRLKKLGAQTRKPVLFFGESKKADVRAEKIKSVAGQLHFTLGLPGAKAPIIVPSPGRFMVSNALAAAAAGYLAGLDIESIRAGLLHFEPVTNRMNVFPTKRGVTIIDDSYNANPGSMAAAIHTLVSLAGDQRRILVVGDMLELGSEAETLHYEMGLVAAKAGVSILLATGTQVENVARGARAGDMADKNIVCSDKKGLIETLKKLLTTGDHVLVKGSRGSAMEEVVVPIKQWALNYNQEEKESKRTCGSCVNH